MAMNTAHHRMSDYQRIKITRPPEMYWQQRKHRLSPAMAARRHDASRQWLKEQLGLGDTENMVVVTHHAPHPRSIPLEFEGHPRSPCYASDLEALMGKASTWIHGHIHASLDYQVRGTRIVTNPRGYRRRGGGTQNSEFRVDFCVDVG